MRNILAALLLTAPALTVRAQAPAIPASYANIHYDEHGRLYFQKAGQRFYADTSGPRNTLAALQGAPRGTDEGLQFDFGNIRGTLTYGMIPYGKAAHPLPVFRFSVPLREGKAAINIKRDFRPPYDFVDWNRDKRFTLGYRLTDEKGGILYDGETAVEGNGPFTVVPGIAEGPFVSNLRETGAVIWFRTTDSCSAQLTVNGKNYGDTIPKINHEIAINDLRPGQSFSYTVRVGHHAQTYSLATPPRSGSRRPFVFAYASDSRAATGGGERNIQGANAYIMKKLAALAVQQKAAFVQFTGDMINGYLSNKEDIQVQYRNWKKAVEPFWHYIPFYVGQGNHEALGYIFRDSSGAQKAFIDKFPFETESAESALAEAFVNPQNGPAGEDGNRYDPDPLRTDFPSYKENVYYYTYDNVAMIVLNSDYWFAPTVSRDSSTGGGLHGYLMDNQLDWLRETLARLEKDPAIDHIFLTQHTPVFPNGGHSGDDMWYHGNNGKRTYVAGKPVDKGIIERRDEYLDLLINKSRKVLAVLTGDEHNYNRLRLSSEVNIYPENYPHPRLKVSRPIYQINNGAAGAPYYGQEQLPWSEHTRAFSVENALCLFYINGKSVRMKVINPDTLNPIDEIRLR